MGKKRFLSKSRFKVASTCPTKIFYLNKPEYGNKNIDNQFLEALAEGGFQVGEIAKIYYPDGELVSTLDSEQAVAQTALALKRDNVTLYEAAIQFDNFIMRADLLIKNGSYVELIEVKAKSFNSEDENQFYNKKKLQNNVRELNKKWSPYLMDVAFQSYVLKKAHPELKVSCFLMLADKTATATVDGINQKFLITSEVGTNIRIRVKEGTTKESLGAPLLIKVPVDDEVAIVQSAKFEGLPFDEYLAWLAEAYANDKRLYKEPGQQCKSCEYRIDGPDLNTKSGFDECWQSRTGLPNLALKRPFVFDLWNFRKAEKLISVGTFFVDQLTKEDVGPTEQADEIGLSSSERQWLQAEKIIAGDKTPYLDRDGLEAEIAKWKYPLHFIDFETSMVAIPFHIGRRPYEQIAFQFSHHTVSVDGTVEHRDQYINLNRGCFPNFDFLRALKKSLSADEGTIFRFASHENTVLCQILNQLKFSKEADRVELIEWIKTITAAPEKSLEKWTGQRNMIDMRELVLKYFYHPSTGGSNSIKAVLPAVLAESEYLKTKYKKSDYGSSKGVKSLNFKDWAWVKTDESGRIADPYSLLEPIFTDLTAFEMDTLESILAEDHRIADGGAAMTAYARMQFSEMSDQEVVRVSKALLKYCELDTFAMVMIFEYWREELKRI